MTSPTVPPPPTVKAPSPPGPTKNGSGVVVVSSAKPPTLNKPNLLVPPPPPPQPTTPSLLSSTSIVISRPAPPPTANVVKPSKSTTSDALYVDCANSILPTQMSAVEAAVSSSLSDEPLPKLAMTSRTAVVPLVAPPKISLPSSSSSTSETAADNTTPRRKGSSNTTTPVMRKNSISPKPTTTSPVASTAVRYDDLMAWMVGMNVDAQTAIRLYQRHETITLDTLLLSVDDAFLRDCMGVVALNRRLNTLHALWLSSKWLPKQQLTSQPPPPSSHDTTECVATTDVSSATLQCQSLVRTKVCRWFFEERNLERRASLEKLVGMCRHFASEIKKFRTVVIQPTRGSTDEGDHHHRSSSSSLLNDEEVKAFAFFSDLQKTWSDLGTALESKLAHWCHLSSASSAFTRDSVGHDWLMAAFIMHFNSRGQSRFTLEKIATQEKPKLDLFFKSAATSMGLLDAQQQLLYPVLDLFYNLPSQQLTALRVELESFIANTHPNHPDFPSLNVICGKLRELERIGMKMAMQDDSYRANAASVKFVVSRMVGGKEDFHVWQRSIVAEGEVIRLSPDKFVAGKTKHESKCHFILFSDLFVLCTLESSSKFPFRWKESCDLKVSNVHDIVDGTEILGTPLVRANNALAIKHTTECCFIMTDSPDQKAELMGLITRQIKALQDRLVSQREEDTAIKYKLGF